MRGTVKVARTAAISGAAALVLAGSAWAKPGADRAYTIANYPVQARAANAVAAKDAAIADGQKAAFRSLLKRIVPVTSYRDMERLAATQAPPAIVVPLTRDGKAAAGPAGEFRAAAGSWGTVWPTLDLENSVAPLKMQALRPEVGPDTLRGLYDDATRSASIMTLAAAYGTDQVVLAVAEVDTEGGKVNVLIAGQDAAGPFALNRAYRMQDGDLAYTLELAAVVSQGILEGRWKAVNSGGAAAYGPGGQDVAFDAQFAGQSEWNAMRRVLLEAPGIDDIRIGTVSAGRASVSVKYPGGGPALAQALAAYGMSLTDTGGLWVMRQGR